MGRGRPRKNVKGKKPSAEAEAAAEAEATAKTLARDYTADALQVLAQLLSDPDAKPNVRLQAAEALLNRGWGRPLTRSRQINRADSNVDPSVKAIVYLPQNKRSANGSGRVIEAGQLQDPADDCPKPTGGLALPPRGARK